MLLVLLASALLAFWFYRRNFADASIWMLATYVTVGVLLYQDYNSVSAAHDALPKIVRDFMLLGMVGFVQSLAVAKRISIATAVVIIFCLFAGAYFLNDVIAEEGAPVVAEPSFTTQDAGLDANGELLIQVKHADRESFKADAFMRGWSIAPAFAPKDADATELDDYYILDVPGAASAQNIANAERELAAMDKVIYFEPNESIDLDPFNASVPLANANPENLLGINDPETGQQWAMRVLKMNEYFAELQQHEAKKQAKLVILDTGIDSRHEDLGDNYFSIDKKYDNDPMGHGTHCAGIAAGVTNNGIGIGSLAGTGRQPFVRVSSIKVLNAAGMGTQKTIIAGIIEATDEGADVISLSLGGPSNASRQKAYSQAVAYAQRHGAIVVAAAGNSNMDAYNYAPANAKGIITVSALDMYLLRAPFSNKVDRLDRGIAAPGVAIFSTTPNNTYKAYSGTSMACPFVAGLLSVMKSIQPDLDYETAYEILHETGQDVTDGIETGRVVQPAAALRALD